MVTPMAEAGGRSSRDPTQNCGGLGGVVDETPLSPCDHEELLTVLKGACEG